MAEETKVSVQRPSIDEYYMEMCSVIAKRSTCLRHHFGAIIVKNKMILSTGYNGAAVGMPHCSDIGCLRDELKMESGTRHEICRAVHAEQNAILQCALHGVSSEGATIYTNGSPCMICAKMIVNAGLKRVVYDTDYPDKLALELLGSAGIEVLRFQKNHTE